MKKNVMA